MKNKALHKVNTEAIAVLLLEFAEAVTVKAFNEDEHRGVIKFLAYLIEKWDGETYDN